VNIKYIFHPVSINTANCSEKPVKVKVKVKQSSYRLEVAQRVPGS